MKERFRSYIGLASMLLLAQQCFAASTVQFFSRVLTVAEDAGQAELTVVRANDTDTLVAAEFFCIEGTATADQDYTPASGAVTFLPGETNHTIVIPILNDGLIEPLERFRVALTNLTGDAVLGAMKIATVSIHDNDRPIQLGMSAYSVDENCGNAKLTVIRNDDGATPVTVEYVTEDGSALAGVDYVATNGLLVLPTNRSSQQINVSILNDRVSEAAKSFKVSLIGAAGPATLGDVTNAIVTIQDNDIGFTTRLARYSVSEGAGDLRVTVVRAGDPGEAATVTYSTKDNLALEGVDYVATKGTLYFSPEDMEQDVLIPPLTAESLPTCCNIF